MEVENKFATAINKKIAGVSYKPSGDSMFTITHPSLNEIGRQAHAHWFGLGLRGKLPRRRQLIDLANELLNHVAESDAQAVSRDVERVDPALLAFAKKLTVDPPDERVCLIGFALSSALQIIDANEKLDDLHYLGGSVYGPLLILEGLLMEPRTRSLKAKPRVPAVAVVRADYATYVEGHDGRDLHWLDYARKKYNVSYDHMGRVWRKMKKTA